MDAEERMFNLLMECPPELDSEPEDLFGRMLVVWVYDTMSGRKVISRTLPMGIEPGETERAAERRARELGARTVRDVATDPSDE